MRKPLDVVKDYLAAFDRHDLVAARSLLHDDYRFEGPLMQAANADQFITQLKAFGCDFTNKILQIAETGSVVGVLFECTFTKPSVATLRMSEWFTVDGGKLRSSRLIYDTRQMPMAPAA
jgi:hypothetical protein